MREGASSIMEYLEANAPLSYHLGLIIADDISHKLITPLGEYQITAEQRSFSDVLAQALTELEVELPRFALIKVEGDDLSVLISRPHQHDEGKGECFELLPTRSLTVNDEAMLWKIIEAQGGGFKRFGLFRFDPSLARQNLFNCPNCGEIWKPRSERPVRCPKCRASLVDEDRTRAYANVFPIATCPDEIESARRSIDPLGSAILHSVSEHRELPDRLFQGRSGQKVSSSSASPSHLTLLSGSIVQLLDRYDSQFLNMVRSPEENDEIINILDSAERLILSTLDNGFPDLRFWTDSVRPIGNWPVTPWIAFGLKEYEGRRDVFHGSSDEFRITCDMLFDTDSGLVALAILPVVKELKKRYGQGWSLELSRSKADMRERIGWLSADGFRLDDEANLGTAPNSPGDWMRQSIVAYRQFERKDLKEDELVAAIIAMMRAYVELVR